MTYTREQIAEMADLHERAWGEDPEVPPIHHAIRQLLDENERLREGEKILVKFVVWCTDTDQPNVSEQPSLKTVGDLARDAFNNWQRIQGEGCCA